MRGEHFVLLAERERLVTPEIADQLRRLLKAQSRPATGEAVARLLVDRGFLSVEQARRLIQIGSGPSSPLVGSGPLSPKPKPRLEDADQSPVGLAPASPGKRQAHSSEELLLEPRSQVEPPPVVVTGASAAAGTPSDKHFERPAPPPVVLSPTELQSLPVADQQALAELSDSFTQWMELPSEGGLPETPSPLFAEPRWKPHSIVVYMGLTVTAILLVLVGLILMAKMQG